MTTYLIPGLGGDKRMYEAQLKRYPNTRVIEFIEPFKNETIESYTRRLSSEIDTSEPFQLLGVSLGGIMCVEIAKFLNPERVILISSVKSRRELPLWIRFFKFFPVQKIIPGAMYLWMFLILVRIKSLTLRRNFITARLRDMARDADRGFVYWAVHRVVTWRNMEVPKNVVHIHGRKDYLFPLYRCKVDHTIEKGTHAMILTHAREINDILKQYL